MGNARFVDASGSIFDSGADVLVCPVNAVPGVMGAGLALAFARRWPGLRRRHAGLARDGLLAPGCAPIVGEVGQRFCLFPTKRHWRMAFPALLRDDADRLGVRTRELPTMVRAALAEAGVRADVADGMTELLQTFGRAESTASNGEIGRASCRERVSSPV